MLTLEPSWFHTEGNFKEKFVSFLRADSFLDFRRCCLEHNDFADSMSIMSVLATRYDNVIPWKVVFLGCLCSLAVHLQSPPTPAAVSALRDGKIYFV